MGQPGTTPAPRGPGFTVLVAPLLVALFFIYAYALQYLSMDPERLGIFWPVRQWLQVHVVGGVVALLAGPIQLWIGRTREHPLLHGVLGTAYAVSVAASSVAAVYLALQTGFGWVFGMGLGAMALGWILSTGLAAIAFLRRRHSQYREWMIRSYVVTFGFVSYQVLLALFKAIAVGTTVEQLTAAGWCCWSVPLLITESVLQGRKIFSADHVETDRSSSEHSTTILSPRKNDAA